MGGYDSVSDVDEATKLGLYMPAMNGKLTQEGSKYRETSFWCWERFGVNFIVAGQ